MPRVWVWVQVLFGWIPVWALYSALIVAQHGPMSPAHAGVIALRSIVPAALLGVGVHRLARRVPWPHPFRLRFALLHLAAAPSYAILWIAASSLVDSVIRSRLALVSGPGIFPFAVLGIWLYAMVAGISYAIEATARAARAEASVTRTQLAALRAQLHPHFLFNALHTVVQLIPTEPARAQDAAEQLAGLLRATVEEDRDLVRLRDEWAFVSQYLELERIRFGDRLEVRTSIASDLAEVTVPSYALQTLVENAVRHGAAPRVEPTTIDISARAAGGTLSLVVRDTGAGGASTATRSTGATGLARLRERLAALYGDAARLDLALGEGGGCKATLVIPLRRGSDE